MPEPARRFLVRVRSKAFCGLPASTADIEVLIQRYSCRYANHAFVNGLAMHREDVIGIRFPGFGQRATVCSENEPIFVPCWLAAATPLSGHSDQRRRHVGHIIGPITPDFEGRWYGSGFSIQGNE